MPQQPENQFQINFVNNRSVSVDVLMEPSGLAYELRPNETARLHTKKQMESLDVELTDEFIKVFVYEAILFVNDLEFYTMT